MSRIDAMSGFNAKLRKTAQQPRPARPAAAGPAGEKSRPERPAFSPMAKKKQAVNPPLPSPA